MSPASWLPSSTDVADVLDRTERPAAGSAFKPRTWSLPVPVGAYAAVPCWWGSDHWFDALMDALRTPERDALRKRWSVADTTLLAIANGYRHYADPDTGRGVAVSQLTIAAMVGRDVKTIQRATRLLEALNFLVTLVVGRSILSADEKAEAFQTHGERQDHASCVVALTLPPVQNSPLVNENVHLNTPSLLSLTSPENLEQQTRASAQLEVAPLPRPRQDQVNSAEQARPVRETRLIGRHRYLAELDRHYSNALGRGRPMGQIDRLLRRAGVDPGTWSVQDLVTRLDTRFPDSHDKLLTAHDPLRYFGWMVGRAITPGEEPPRIRLDKRAHELEDERADFARRKLADAERMATTDPRDTARIKAASDANIQARNQSRQALMDVQGRDTAPVQSDIALITVQLLGAGRRPGEFPESVQKLYRRVLNIHQILAGRGWTLNRDEADMRVEWNWPASHLADPDQEVWEATSISFEPPATADADTILGLGLAGASWEANSPLTDATLATQLAPIEAHRA